MRISRLAGLLMGGVGFIAAAMPAMAVDEARLQRFFTLMDSDGDQQISRPEFQYGKGAVFLVLDQDGSMTLTANEMRLTPEAFKQLAGDDGVIDGEEFIAADAMAFEAIDHDKDNQLSFAELRDYVAKYSQ